MNCEEPRELQQLRDWLARSAVETPAAETMRRVHAALGEAAEAEAWQVRAQPPAVMTLGEVAEYLRVGEPEARRVAHEIPHFLVAGHLRFRREMVARWVETQERRTLPARGPVLALVPEEGTAWALVG